MLYKQSKEYLLEKLKAAGLKSKPYTTQKGLEKSQESHIGAVLFESETLLRNGSKTRYRDQEGAQKKRRKVFDRALTFTVIIGDYTDEAVESMFGAFLSSLDRGIYVNGDYVPIEVEGPIGSTRTTLFSKHKSPFKFGYGLTADSIGTRTSQRSRTSRSSP